MLTGMALIPLLSMMMMACGGVCDGLDEADCLEDGSCVAEYETIPCVEPPCSEEFLACVESSGAEDTE